MIVGNAGTSADGGKNMEDRMQIYTAITEAMADIGAVSKDKYNNQQGFKFRGIDDVMNTLKPILTKHKIFTVPQVLEQTRETRMLANGKELRYSLLKIAFRFYTCDGSYVEAVTQGEGMDNGDKASNKAMAIAYKYALFQVFCIPTEEMQDPDADSYETVGKAQDKAPQQQKAQKATKVPPKANAESPTQFLLNECNKMEMGMDELASARTALIDAKIVRDVPTKSMTMEDAKALVNALRVNFRGEAS